MSKSRCGLVRILGAGLLALGLAGPAEAVWRTQSFSLRQGWNLIHLKVCPVESNCNTLFAGSKIKALTWYKRETSGDGSGEVPSASSKTWFRDSSEGVTFNALVGGECYLVQAEEACTISFTGVPAKPKGFIKRGESNLLGVYVPAEGATPNLATYFGGCGNLASTPFHIINAANSPVMQISSAKVNANGAVWVTATGEGSQEWTGPLSVSAGSGSGAVIEWTRSSEARIITLRNNTTSPRKATFNLVASATPPKGQGTVAGAVPLLYGTPTTEGGYFRYEYAALTDGFSVEVPAEGTYELRIRPDLAAMAVREGADYMSLIRISDKGTAGIPSELSSGVSEHYVGVKAKGDLAGDTQLTGLWQGSVAITGVNRARSASSVSNTWNTDDVQEASQSFEYRILMHYDYNGAVKLLKQVFICTEPEASGSVLFTTREGAIRWRAANPQGTIRLVSAANFPYDGMPLNLAGTGEFATGGAVFSGTIAQAHDEKTNPFVHAFHPQHDNLEFVNGKPKKKSGGTGGTGDYESWSVSRKLDFTFAAEDPAGMSGVNDWNRKVTGGTVNETIYGLTSEGIPIKAEGVFRLHKLNESPMLDPVSE